MEFRLLCLFIFVSLLKTASHLSNLLSPVASVLVRMDIQLPYNCVLSPCSVALLRNNQQVLLCSVESWVKLYQCKWSSKIITAL